MKTTAPEQTSISKLDQLAGETSRLITEVETAETNLSTATARTEELNREIESAEESLIHGRINSAALKLLRDRRAALGAETVQLSSDIRMNRRLLEKAQAALAAETARSNRERRQQASRNRCEQIAPLLDQACRAIIGLLSIDGVSEELPSLDGNFQTFACPILKVREALAGGDSALIHLIHDLGKHAPDLLTSPMRAFLDIRPPQYQRPAEPAVDSKTAAKAMLKSGPLFESEYFSYLWATRQFA